MADIPTADCVIPASLVDRLAGFLVLLQKEDPVKIVLNIAALQKSAGAFQAELQALRGPWAVCYLCAPPMRIKIEELTEHDVKNHGKVFKR